MKTLSLIRHTILAASLLAGLAHADDNLQSVFHDFGDKPGLVSIMDDFMANLLADERTKPFFAKADQTRVKAMLVDQFCMLLDGPCKYTGHDMDAAHSGMPIYTSHFNALVEDLQLAMDKHNVPFSSQNKLLAKLAPMHRVVIQN